MELLVKSFMLLCYHMGRPASEDATDWPNVSYPRFAHGDDLYVLVSGGGSWEFRSESRGEFVKSDIVVDLRHER